MLYYITDRTQFSGDETCRRRLLLANIAEAARCGVDYIQLREKDLSTRELEWLARQAVEVIRGACPARDSPKSQTKLLINSRSDVAMATASDGVHLRAKDISVLEVKKIWKLSGTGAVAPPTVAVSCHCLDQVARAADEGASFVVFGPVFKKENSSVASGMAALRKACTQGIRVLALGGITLENASVCLDAGAAGIAGIRLFQQNQLLKVVDFFRRQPPP
jgi:thiamine-phosphate pyrophosphorylase